MNLDKAITAIIYKPNKSLKLPFLVLLISSTYISTTSAHNISVGYSQLTQYVNVLDQSIQVKPVGTSIAASFDLAEQWQVSIDYQQHQNDENYQNNADVSVDLSTVGAGISYFTDDFSYSLYYSKSNDDFSVISQQNSQNKQVEEDQSSLISASVDYAWGEQQWFYNASLTLLYNKFDNNTLISKQNFDQQHQRMFLEEFNQQNNGNYTMLSSGASAAYMWSLSNDKVIILGSMLSWSYQLSGDSQANNDSTMRVRNSSTRNSTSRVNTGTRTAGQINNTLNGDDNYGQLVIYTAYDLTSTLSLDVDFTKNVATQNNEQSWSVGLSYSF